MNKELEKLLLYFKNTKEPHCNKANELIMRFVNNLNVKEKKEIEEIVSYLRSKNTEYYKNYRIEQFIRAYIFNKNNGRNVGSLTDYIRHYKKHFSI